MGSGTDGSNPSPSSGESVSLPHPVSKVENPAFGAGVCGWLGDRVGRDAQGVSIARQPAAISLSRHIFGPLHCVPLIVRDNFNTADVPTTAGSLSLKGSVPPVDAFQVRKLREAVTVILAKSNMPEFA